MKKVNNENSNLEIAIRLEHKKFEEAGADWYLHNQDCRKWLVITP